MAYSDEEEGRQRKQKTKEKKETKPTPSPFHHSTGNLATRPQANSKNRVVDESPQKSSFPKKGTTKSKLKHLNKKVFSKLYESSHV